ncbi:tyrosine-type recombinase/integrase [Sphingomonas mucosissima]|uniref:Putative prophage CPS-53 integrase n=1 Tax=Sphingomonas mucosissima TaxID=370959 RepID=A0A245ZRE5_9SPHN|nr:integrase arm-type DNA-binding domain-containing protein [Sphingomonas mucosissima]OWK32311.1 putative prophage CPS-53 integrase [Sphingomonas mucosissima]
MLTNAAVKAARPRAAAYKLADGAGLHLYVAPTGLKSFRWRFRVAGKEQLLTLGSYPEVDLLAARARADAAREQLARGEDPRTRSTRVETFEAAARAWHAVQLEGWTPVHATDVLVSLERDVFPAIGPQPLSAIAPADVLELLRAVERRGARETARRLRQRISAVFELAIGEGWCEIDPAEKVARGLKKPAAVRHHAALMTTADACALLAEVDQLDASPAAKLASRFLALTAMRWAAVRGARWSEIEDLEGAAPIWRVPAARMKLAAAKKGDAAHDHVVPLSPAAVAVLHEARDMHLSAANMHHENVNLHDGLVFCTAGRTSPLGEAAIGALYARTSFAGLHVPHGWRATFSTIMNETMPLERGAIDQALGHTLKAEDGSAAKVEGAYNRSQQLDRRRRIFNAWGAALTPVI